MIRFTALLLVASCAFANDTAIHDGADGPAPIGGTRGPESVIRMVREHLEITVGREKTEVRATFVFRNTKTDASAQQTVGFPDITGSRASGLGADEGDFSGPLERLRTFVDGKERKSRSVRCGSATAWISPQKPVKRARSSAFGMRWMLSFRLARKSQSSGAIGSLTAAASLECPSISSNIPRQPVAFGTAQSANSSLM